MAHARTLDELRARLEAIEIHRDPAALPGVVTGWGQPIESLARGVLHEWCCPAAGGVRGSSAPLLLFAHLARQATRDIEGACERWIIWIGRHVWPHAHALALNPRDRALIERSMLIDPTSDEDRLWAIDLCVRSAAVAAVIADARGVHLAQSRRLQLAAEAGDALTLLACPASAMAAPSASATRWRVECIPSPTARPRWRVQLVRCKGVQRYSSREADASVVLEHHRATGCVRIHAAVADQSNHAPAQALRSA